MLESALPSRVYNRTTIELRTGWCVVEGEAIQANLAE